MNDTNETTNTPQRARVDNPGLDWAYPPDAAAPVVPSVTGRAAAEAQDSTTASQTALGNEINAARNHIV